jgi:hypothetical protein
MERDARVTSDLCAIRVIRNDEANHTPKLARSIAPQKVVETVTVSGDKNRNVGGDLRIPQPYRHSKTLSDLRNSVFYGDPIGVNLRKVEANPLKKLPYVSVGVLIRIYDIGTMTIK